MVFKNEEVSVLLLRIARNYSIYAFLILIIIIAGVIATVCTAKATDDELRRNLLHQAQLVAPAISIDRIKTLTGTGSDLLSADYIRLKEQFTAIHSVDPQFRFVYLLGRKTDGTIFVFLDSEPVSSKDYSPPGQVYEEVSAGCRSIFDTKSARVEGPDIDRWGVWVSTLVPITDPDTGKVVAIMGMDTDAHDWKWKVASRTAMPMIMVFIIVIMLLMWANGRRITIKLKENEEKYRRFFDTSLDCTFITSPEGKIIDANDISMSLLGYPDRKDLLKTNIVHIYARAEDREIFLNILKENGYVKEHPVELRKKDGTIMQCIVTAVIIKGTNGGIAGIQAIVRDISEKKRSENKIRKANEQLSVVVKKLKTQQIQSQILTEMREFLQACSTTSEIGPVVEQSMKKLFPDSDGALFLMSPSKTDLESIAKWGDYPESMDENILALDECWGLRRGGLYIADKTKGDILCSHIKQQTGNSYACLPLMAKGEVLGLLHLRSKTGQDNQKFIEELKNGSTALIELLALAISNIKLREKLSIQSIKDPLTGLFNRRYLEETFLREATRARRKQVPIGIIMVDIDHFKKFNDIFGHAAGDLVLAELAKFFTVNLRGCDIVCRYGGEEFALVLPDANLENTFIRAQNMVELVRTLRLHFSGQALGQITLSMGVSAYPVHGEKLEDLLRKADTCLYQAKQEGRDRVIAADVTNQ